MLSPSCSVYLKDRKENIQVKFWTSVKACFFFLKKNGMQVGFFFLEEAVRKQHYLVCRGKSLGWAPGWTGNCLLGCRQISRKFVPET